MGGGVRARFGRSLSGFVSSNVFIDPRVSEPVDEKARLALALYREDLSVNSVPYQFLGFAKIINVLHAGGSAQKAWIGAVLPNVTDADARARLAELSGEVADVSAYLFESGRCAVAHANTSPVVNPDDVEDFLRLSKDLPLIKALAEHLIETELGVPRRRPFSVG